MKKVFILLLIGAQMLAACSTGEVVAGAVGVGVGVGLSRWYDRHHGHRHHRNHSDDRYYGDRYGYTYGANLETNAMANNDAQNFADKHGISLDAAKKIQKAFDGLPDKGLASFKAIGLGKADLKAIAKQDLPASDSIQAMAEKLDMSQAQARDLLLSMNRDFKAQASNVKSTYWKSCMKDGEWSTPQNSYCTKASWNGCSPATGASMCY